jgi:hypothetical protein
MIGTLDEYLDFLKDKVLANQNLCKYLYYDDKNPLSKDDISNTKQAIFKDKKRQRLFVTPFTVDTTDVTKTTLTIMLDRFEIDSKNMYYEDLEVSFIIACNVRLWELADEEDKVKLRVNGIWEELNNTFKKQGNIGLGKNYFKYGRIQKFNDWFWGYTFCLSAKDFPFVGR